MAVGFCAVLATSSCAKGKQDKSNADDVLITIGDSTLKVSQVVARIPTNVTGQDSIDMFNRIASTWVEDMIMTRIAADNIPDLQDIERKVADYRNHLILEEYKDMMRRQHSGTVSDAEVRRYYEQWQDSMLLTVPLVKGIYIKVPSDAEQLDDIRRWVADGSSRSIDRLEKYGLKEAIQYDWFGDTWTDFRVIADRIPYKFGDYNTFVKNTTNFETTAYGSTWLLHIIDRKEVGDVMPYEFAAPQIAEMLNKNKGADYDRRLLRSLYNEGVKSGKIKPGLLSGKDIL